MFDRVLSTPLRMHRKISHHYGCLIYRLPELSLKRFHHSTRNYFPNSKCLHKKFLFKEQRRLAEMEKELTPEEQLAEKLKNQR